MSSYWFNQNETFVHIPEAVEIDSVTNYVITINVSSVQWKLMHRYKDFFELHNQLIVDHGVAKDLLPPKKVINNKCPTFVETRRKALEIYLQYLMKYFKRTMPRVFIEFLNFHLYEIFFLLQDLAFYFYKEADGILANKRSYRMNLLQLHSIHECMKRPFPEIEQTERCYDFSHVLDFCSQLETLIVNEDVRGETYLYSNIIPKKLAVAFTAFKSVKNLNVLNTSLVNVTSLGTIRSTTVTLNVHCSSMRCIGDILQCDILHKNTLDDKQIWHVLIKMDLSSNDITNIDEAIKLAPNLETLFLANNKLTSITNLANLTKLTYLNLSNNLIQNSDDLHTKLGNVSTLDLTQNMITNLDGMSKLYSLQNLLLGTNRIATVSNVSSIGELPCLESLVLTGNPVSTEIDYRVRVFQIFAEHGNEICLDNEKASQAESDKVSVLRAIQVVKDGRHPIFKHH